MRSQSKTPKGKIVWRGVKVAIFARLGERLSRAGKAVLKLRQRRLVAVLGNLEAFIPLVQLEAQKQQRFKGVGMHWSETGLNHLLILRVAWANQRFDALFPSVPKGRLKHPSLNT
jgi:hypothetical protein